MLFDMTHLIRISLLLLLSSVVGCYDSETKIAVESADSFEQTIQQIIESESTILDLAPYISKIGAFLTDSNDQSKDALREIFAGTTRYKTVGATSSQSVDNFLDELWQPFLGKRKFIECHFGTEEGTLDASKQRFEMKTHFEGKLRDGKGLCGITATQTITWTKINKLWTITDWTQHSFDKVETSRPLFEDVTATVIPEAKTLEAVSSSSHEQRVREAIRTKNVMEPLVDGLPGFNDWESAWQFPSASVVDYDGDGWDDVFLMDRWSGGMMLRNESGNFEDTTNESGLNVGPNANCVVFADFDNDGDQDAFVGHSIQDSQYFINENGTFRHDVSMGDELKLVRFVTAGSVADVNGDGLLDLYLSTYVSPSGSASKINWVAKMLPHSDRKKIEQLQGNHPYVDRGGPANILFLNENGKLKRCDGDDVLKQWRNSYQSVWHDWDNDGDQDLFVCNDFAPDAFLRNDTVRGSSKPVFVDVTKRLIAANTMGYSMGGSWGDFDNDGDMDLYVSEMYSKAGTRILRQFAEADPRSVESAKGNFLFRSDGDRFTQVAGSGEDDFHVAKVGWSFGGQFVDFDNDGWLDLYVPSGFYTAPQDVRGNADL